MSAHLFSTAQDRHYVGFQHLAPLLFVLLFYGCTPTRHNLVLLDNPPLFYDDGSMETLASAIDHQLHFLERQDDTYAIIIDGKAYGVSRLRESLKTFRDIINLQLSPLELDNIIQQNFTVFQAGGRPKRPGEMLVTGYYEPVLQGSLEKVPPFLYPIYRVPDDLVQRSSHNGEKKIGRIDTTGTFLPYWTREEIESRGLAHGFELVYLKDPFDAFLLHVQGSGKVQLPDGTVRSLHYRANNGLPYSSIGKLLLDEKKMALADIDMGSIRGYLLQNPSELKRILNHNRRYIFFEWSEEERPRGSIGLPLTPGRSIAIDKTALPMGMIGYLLSRKPEIGPDGKIVRWVILQRFVVPQDSGSAITGPGRVDLFWGSGIYAETAAGAMKEMGKLYFLIKNDGAADGANDEQSN